MKLGFAGWVVLLAAIAIGGTSLAVAGGYVTQAQVDVVLGNLSDAVVWVIAQVFQYAALPVGLTGVFLLATHGKDHFIRFVSAAVIFAIVAGLVDFGAWDALKASGGSFGKAGGHIFQQVVGIATR